LFKTRIRKPRLPFEHVEAADASGSKKIIHVLRGRHI
jgi:hypothetical protein